ncbi:uncharacterized protein CLUP02_16188 [Colletotrichum lupini]|uniref:Uncharacterized protein n=1 Tax=Colletotrichum lupini TaxID=145971 RepID=A0A9Q8T7I7_9PEZI|nr:uncharacterized protein CLUP02_16188 [Colletotrichum lupini]UQC90658.1 hypothetical protein CLUP02_16188 [Colletotrichum lupini]
MVRLTQGEEDSDSQSAAPMHIQGFPGLGLGQIKLSEPRPPACIRSMGRWGVRYASSLREASSRFDSSLAASFPIFAIGSDAVRSSCHSLTRLPLDGPIWLNNLASPCRSASVNSGNFGGQSAKLTYSSQEPGGEWNMLHIMITTNKPIHPGPSAFLTTPVPGSWVRFCLAMEFGLLKCMLNMQQGTAMGIPASGHDCRCYSTDLGFLGSFVMGEDILPAAPAILPPGVAAAATRPPVSGTHVSWALRTSIGSSGSGSDGEVDEVVVVAGAAGRISSPFVICMSSAKLYHTEPRNFDLVCVDTSQMRCRRDINVWLTWRRLTIGLYTAETAAPLALGRAFDVLPRSGWTLSSGRGGQTDPSISTPTSPPIQSFTIITTPALARLFQDVRFNVTRRGRLSCALVITNILQAALHATMRVMFMSVRECAMTFCRNIQQDRILTPRSKILETTPQKSLARSSAVYVSRILLI